MKPDIKKIVQDIKDNIPHSGEALSIKPMAVNERMSSIQLWQNITSPHLLVHVLEYIEELEAKQKLWVEPTTEMVQAGLAEVQRQLDEWDEEGCIQLGHGADPVNDDQASDLAVFVLQAMAEKLPKDK